MVDPQPQPPELGATEAWKRPEQPWQASGGRFGRYQIDRLLGKGGMGAVYLAHQLDLGRVVVIKVIAAAEVSPMLIERFHREARAAARITSDNVVKVYDVGVEGGVPFIAMEFVNGQPLDKVLGARRVLPFDEAARIVIDAARGLGAAHEAGILHRDVKPGNLLLTREGRAKVTDFGLAKGSSTPGQNSLTQVGTTLGTPSYMPPEQAEGLDVLDGRADIYALGVTFYEMLTGCLPFPGRSVLEIFQRKQDGRFVPPSQIVPAIPQPIEQVCAVMMARSKLQRMGSMAEVVARLEAALALVHGGARPGQQSLAIIPQGASLLGAPAITQASRPSGTASGLVDDLPPGSTFGRYAIQRLLGRGGMGAVYLARQTDLERPVVVKVVHRDRAGDLEMLERLKREAAAAARIESDFVVRVYDSGIERGIPYIAMEFVEGTSLADLVKRRGKLSPLEATRAVLGAARGLKTAHELGIFHRDVKPANILVSKTGKVKIADFGIAKLATTTAGAAAPIELTAPGTLIGTPIYASPEQIDGLPIDARSDIFSLGVTYYQLLAGEVPFAGTTVMQILKSRTMPVPSPRESTPEVPEQVARACLQLMEPERDQRPSDMTAVIELLQPIVVQLSSAGGKGAAAAGAPRPWLVPAVAGGAVALVLGVGLAIGFGGKKTDGTIAGGPSPLALESPPASPRPSTGPSTAPDATPGASPTPTSTTTPTATPTPAPSSSPAVVATPEPTSTPASSPAPLPEASPTPAVSPTPTVSPTPDPSPTPSSAAPLPSPSPSPPSAEETAVAAAFLKAARNKTPAESAAKLQDLVSHYPRTDAGITAALELPVVTELSAETTKADAAVCAELDKLNYDGAQTLATKLGKSLQESFGETLFTLTKWKGIDPRIELAQKSLLEEVALVKKSVSELKALATSREALLKAIKTWDFGEATRGITKMRELEHKLGARGSPDLYRLIDVHELVLRAVHAVKDASGLTQPPSSGPELRKLMEALHDVKDDLAKIGGQLSAAALKKDIPPDLVLPKLDPKADPATESRSPGASLAACLKLLDLPAPKIHAGGPPEPPRPDDREPPPDAPPFNGGGGGGGGIGRQGGGG